jgi:hypothetical protein
MKPKEPNTTFLEHELSASSGVLKNNIEHNVSQTGSVSFLRRGGGYLRTETDPFSETFSLMSFRIRGDRQSPKTQ